MNSNFICPCPLFDLFKAWKVLFEFCLTYLDGILQKRRDFTSKFEIFELTYKSEKRADSS